jgi:hypothetical protein
MTLGLEFFLQINRKTQRRDLGFLSQYCGKLSQTFKYDDLQFIVTE